MMGGPRDVFFPSAAAAAAAVAIIICEKSEEEENGKGIVRNADFCGKTPCSKRVRPRPPGVDAALGLLNYEFA